MDRLVYAGVALLVAAAFYTVGLSDGYKQGIRGQVKVWSLL